MDKTSNKKALAIIALIALVILTVVLGGFSAFVGWHKATAPLELLRENSAWTIHLPVLLGRIVGWLEMVAVAALTAALLVPRLARWGLAGSAWIAANHIVAAGFHVAFEEWHTLTQSAVVTTLCAIWVWLWQRRAKACPPARPDPDHSARLR